MLYVDVFKIDFCNVYDENMRSKKRVARFVCHPNKLLDYIKNHPGMFYEIYEIDILDEPDIKYLF